MCVFCVRPMTRALLRANSHCSALVKHRRRVKSPAASSCGDANSWRSSPRLPGSMRMDIRLLSISVTCIRAPVARKPTASVHQSDRVPRRVHCADHLRGAQHDQQLARRPGVSIRSGRSDRPSVTSRNARRKRSGSPRPRGPTEWTNRRIWWTPRRRGRGKTVPVHAGQRFCRRFEHFGTIFGALLPTRPLRVDVCQISS